MRRNALLASVGAMSLLSGGHACIGQPVSLAYQDMIVAIYYTISTHHELFCGPTEKPGPLYQTVTATKTAILTGQTITNTITTTRYVTLTHTATETASPTESADTEDTGSNCYWLAVQELTQANDLYNLTAEDEILALRGLETRARQSHDKLAQIAEDNPEQASRAHALSEVLRHLVDAPLVKSCDTFLSLADQLILHDIDVLSSPEDEETQHRDSLFDAAFQELENDSVYKRTRPARGVLSDSAAEALPLVIRERKGDAQQYCFQGDCDWPTRILNMWLVTERLRDILKERLRIARAQAQAQAQIQADDGKGTLVSSVLMETGVIVALYGVFRFLSKMTAGPLRA
ncbi:hypothetical protein F5Y08DRAFT_53871 [Xylaria arbuscula]|nr:hypothetical protein F5Y08DRAFT_53871 [Xylaria arbuscula]